METKRWMKIWIVAVAVIAGFCLTPPAFAEEKLYFSAYNAATGNELYSYDGTSVSLVADINPGSGSGYANMIAAYNNKLYFYGYTGTNGAELYSYDGTTASRVTDINPGSGSANPWLLTTYNNKLYFKAADGTNGSELWSFDGTTASLAADIRSGASGSSINANFTGTERRSLTTFNNKLYFNANNGTNGAELYSFDGTTASLAADINPGADSIPCQITPYNNKLYFQADYGTIGSELWSFDGTTASLVADIRSGLYYGSYPQELTVFNNKLYFSASDGTTTGKSGTELWSFDGTTTALAADIRSGTSSSDPTGLTAFNNKLYFSANNGTTGLELWSFDGTNASLVADIASGSAHSFPSGFTVFNNKLYFQADNGTSGSELYSYDGTTVSLAADIWSGSNSGSPAFLTVFGVVSQWNAVSGDWATGGNWQGASSPTASDDVTVNNSGTANVTTSSNAKSLTIGAGSVSVNNGGTLNVGTGNIVNSTGSGTLTVNGGTLNLNGTGASSVDALTMTGGILAGTGTLTSASAFDMRAGSVSAILGGTSGLDKTTSGTLTLTGINVYSGTTLISEGTLALSGSGSIANSTIINVASGAAFDTSGLTGEFALASGQTLKGAGQVTGGLTVGSGSFLSPGNSPGTLTVDGGTMEWASGGGYHFEILNVDGTPGTNWDLLLLDGAVLDITATSPKFLIEIEGLSSIGPDTPGGPNGFLLGVGKSWKFVDGNSLAGSITGFDANKFEFSLLGSGFAGAFASDFAISKAGNDLFIDYAGGAGGGVPEPSSMAVTGLAIGLLGLIKRFRRKK